MSLNKPLGSIWKFSLLKFWRTDHIALIEVSGIKSIFLVKPRKSGLRGNFNHSPFNFNQTNHQSMEKRIDKKLKSHTRIKNWESFQTLNFPVISETESCKNCSSSSVLEAVQSVCLQRYRLFLLFKILKKLLTALRVRSHWKTSLRSCAKISLLVFSRSFRLSSTFVTHTL